MRSPILALQVPWGWTWEQLELQYPQLLLFYLCLGAVPLAAATDATNDVTALVGALWDFGCGLTYGQKKRGAGNPDKHSGPSKSRASTSYPV